MMASLCFLGERHLFWEVLGVVHSSAVACVKCIGLPWKMLPLSVYCPSFRQTSWWDGLVVQAKTVDFKHNGSVIFSENPGDS